MFTSKLLNHSDANSLWEVWQKTAQTYPDAIALHDPHAKPPIELTYRKVTEQIVAFGAGLRSLGIQFGDKVSLIADNSPRWLIADRGILAIGAANATRSSQAERTELLYIIEHSDSIALVVEDIATRQRLQPDLHSLPVRHVILLSDETPPDGAYNFQQIVDRGKDGDLGNPPIGRDTLATLIYTSGTTAKPKGVMLTHGNLLHQVRGGTALIEPNPGDRLLSILPSWHSYERACEYYCLSQGVTQIYTNLRQIKNDLKKYQPNYVIAVPRLWESIYEGVLKQFKTKSAVLQNAIAFFLANSQAYVQAKRVVNDLSLIPGAKFPARLNAIWRFPLHWLADKVVYKTIRQGLGGKIRYLTSGGGSLQPHVDMFYEIVGLEILNGYGLTETSPMLTVRQRHRNLRGSAGVPLPQTEIRIVDPETHQPLELGKIGLVMARGPQIMKGYYKDPEATAKAIDPEGWFDTGDLGWVSAKNDLILTGRAKDTIVLTNGENIEPQAIEDACTRSPYIDQILVVGQDRKQLGALIVPNLDTLKGDRLISPDTDLSKVLPELNREQIQTLYRNELNREVKNRPGFSINDRIGPFVFLSEPFSIANGMMTQTFKIRRNVVTERYRDIIDEMFM